MTMIIRSRFNNKLASISARFDEYLYSTQFNFTSKSRLFIPFLCVVHVRYLRVLVDSRLATEGAAGGPREAGNMEQ